MKTSKLYFFVVAFLALSISMVSCSGDDGETGLIGPKGDNGAQGEAGAVGPAGTDGSVIYSGEGVPVATVGTTGDYCLDVATGMLYGPKVNEDNWTDTDGFSLMGVAGANGADGTNGTNGSKTLSGEGVPDSSLGNAGDYYLDKENSVLYGPKASLVVLGSPDSAWWGVGLELKGADGNANVKTFKLTIGSGDWTATDNTVSSFTKSLKFSTSFVALNKDMYDNGVVLVYYVATEVSTNLYDHVQIQLPIIETTSTKNLLNTFFTIHDWENPEDSNYGMKITKELNCIADSEILTATTDFYRIKLITGQAAVQLKANQNNQIEFERLVDRLVD